MDTETEKHIQRALKKRNANTTTFIIAHRLSTIAHADKILVLDKGRIIERGNHRQLLEQDGLYKKLWKMQNSLDIPEYMDSGVGMQKTAI